MVRTLVALAAFAAVIAPAAAVLADCSGHTTTVQSTTAPQTVVETQTAPTTPIPPATEKTGG
jgi:hypothetical protein